MMKRYLFVFLLVMSPLFAMAGGKYYVKTYYEIRQDDLLQKLSLAASDTMRLNLLNSLIMYFSNNNDPGGIDTAYINQLVTINARARLINDEPYRWLAKAVIDCRKKRYTEAIDLYKKTVDGLEAQHIDAVNVLLQMRWLFNVIDKQEEKLAYYSLKLNYYLQKKDYLDAAGCYHCIAGYYSRKSDNNLAINYYMKAAELFKGKMPSWYTNEILVIGVNYKNWGNLEKALTYLKTGYKQLKSEPASQDDVFALFSLAEVEYKLKNYERSNSYIDTIAILTKQHDPRYHPEPYMYLMRGLNCAGLNQYSDALTALKLAQKNQDTTKIAIAGSVGRYDLEYGFYKYYSGINEPAAAEKNLLEAYHKTFIENNSDDIRLFYLHELVKFYGSQNKLEDAYKYTTLYNKLNDSTQTVANKQKIASYEFEQKENEQHQQVTDLQQQGEVQKATISQRNIIIWISLAGLIAVCVLVVFVYRQLQINKKNLLTLQQTQTQLIQSEKMASLGELTAGIAHEIQNPLNFVNNFSELNVELLDEMELELKNGDKDEAISIASDIKQNLEKIRHHGKRADSIVKGMLQHSRSGGTTKELTDINALADEYLRLAYHGLRAKDKSFNADLVTNFDSKLTKVAVLPQEIGRVLLNLYTNAFYAVQQKQQNTTANYKPTVEVMTKAEKGKVVIKVKDNGTGMPEHVKEKIMQPFFTTKPTGQGTGLGLSMSYDIVVKGHNGTINVETEESEYTEFTITLPV